MADIYLRSTDGSDGDDGSTWALAKATLQAALTAAGAGGSGGTVYVSQAHAEMYSSATTITFPDGVRVLCGNDGAEPPTSEANTATITLGGAYTPSIAGSFYSRGLSFLSATGSTNSFWKFNDNGSPAKSQRFENCNLLNRATGTGVGFSIGGGNANVEYGETRFDNVIMSCGYAPNGFNLCGSSEVNGGSLDATNGTSGTVGFFKQSNASTGRLGIMRISGFDMTNLGTTRALFAASSNFMPTMRNCKLNASWSGSLVDGTLKPGARFSLYNCDSADTNYRLWIEAYEGSIRSETTIVRTGGASDGTTPLAWKLATNANPVYPLFSLKSDPIVLWNEAVGASLTATVEIVHDSQGSGTGSGFTNKEAWIEVEYLGTSGFPLALFDSGRKVFTSTETTWTTSSETWTTTGLTTPVKQKLTVSFTPEEKGLVQIRVYLGVANKTMYVCPKASVA